MSAATSTPNAAGQLRRSAPRLRVREIRSLIFAAILLIVALAVLPEIISGYWVTICTAVAYYSVVSAGLGLLMGRVGLVSLGQIAVLAVGAWIACKLSFSTSLPFPIVLLLTGLITMVLGTIIGLPALRLSGLYLALITLMLAGAITVALRTMNFPNGGPGFLGNDPNHSDPVRRPAMALTDVAYYRYTIVICLILFAIALWHVRGRAGHAWAAIRQSEPAAIAAGVNITLYKLWAFALASFMTGVAGGLLAGDVQRLYAITFTTQQSIILLAVVLMGGIFSLWGGIIAGVLYSLVPALLNNWGVAADWLTILFGIGVLQVLLTAPGGISQQFPRDMKNLYGLITGKKRRERRAPPGGEAASTAQASPADRPDKSGVVE
jgi:branched-chain amino acid transport system permease protein